MPPLLYIHGFGSSGSSGNSAKAGLLKRAFPLA